MRILVTGGFGFIGGRLGQRLQRAGHQVVLGSRVQRAAPDWLPQAQVARMAWEEPQSLNMACAGCDAVVHAAGMNAQDCAADPDTALAFNGAATGRLAETAAAQGVKRLLYLSTAHVYASPLAGTISEELVPSNTHPYASSHLAGERAVLAVRRQGRLDAAALRLSNAFGAPADRHADCWMLLINDLCRQAVQTRSLVLRSSGAQRRDFIPMEEVCRAIEHLLMQSDAMPEVLNVGAGHSQSVLEMAELVRARSRVVLGFEPALQRPESAGEQGAPLDYRIDALTAVGFHAADSVIAEIDALLSFCADVFGPTTEEVA